MNYKAYQYSNENANFINGISIPKVDGVHFDFSITVSQATVPSTWSALGYAISETGQYYQASFHRPCNDAHFRIEVCGLKIDTIAPIFHTTVISSPEEAQSFTGKKSIVFMGCARNCVSSVEDSIATLVKLGKQFLHHRILIFENDSTDGTREKLNQLENAGIISVFSANNLDAHFPMRTQRLSYARNTLLTQARSHSPDYFCVADLDGVLGKAFNENGFFSNFQQEECWDAVFPVNANFYYDVWALRHPELCPGDFMKRLENFSPILGRETAFDLCLRDIGKIKFPQLKGWLPVDSAFGGIGIYKTSSFAHASYIGYSKGHEICEHVLFHRMARESGMQLYINPTFVVNSEFN
jgi:hypothetical protein